MTSVRRPGRRGRAAMLNAYVAPEVVAHILSDGRVPLLSGVRLPATILFADLSGFTRLAAALPAERVVVMLDAFFEAMTAAAVGSGAMIDKLIGDAIMLVFGVPTQAGDEAARALRVAAAMHARFARLLPRWAGIAPGSVRLGLAIGCASGPVVLANVGSAARMDYTVVGPAVNLAARLVAAAPAGVTLIDAVVREEALAHAPEAFRFGPQRRLRLKGVARPVAAHALLEAREGARRRTVAEQVLQDPVCGMKLSRPIPYQLRRRAKFYAFCSRRCREVFIGRAPGSAGRVRRR